ncbi:hypothetical protein SUDANB180_05707 [Streptomyces sp. enrichment culture]
MNTATLRLISVAAAILFCVAASISAAPESKAAAPSPLKCYKTIRDPHSVVCYRMSYRPLFRDGRITFVPFLVQVPTPADPPPVTTVGELPPT